MVDLNSGVHELGKYNFDHVRDDQEPKKVDFDHIMDIASKEEKTVRSVKNLDNMQHSKGILVFDNTRDDYPKNKSQESSSSHNNYVRETAQKNNGRTDVNIKQTNVKNKRLWKYLFGISFALILIFFVAKMIWNIDITTINNESSSAMSEINCNEEDGNNNTAQKIDIYMLPNSSTKYLEISDIEGLSAWELRVARNEIYARLGRRFKDLRLQQYFDNCTWYNGIYEPDDFDNTMLSDIEKTNAFFIRDYEIEKGYIQE